MLRKITQLFTFWSVTGLILGALGGWLYYYRVGCQSGSCPLWSNPWLSLLWGAAAGYFLFDLLSGKKIKKDEPPAVNRPEDTTGA